MCGIAGVVGGGYDRDTIRRMTGTLTHRGPDDEGFWSDDGVHFGHRRLSILDLSPAGHQPMTVGDATIVYNGEIYNFPQLRQSLPGPFRSRCDTEVILHLYERYGERCVEHLHGMFAFAIWDAGRRRLFAARDRLGIKPFFYRVLDRGASSSRAEGGDGGGLAFASEIKALLELGQPAIDPTAVRDFFSYKYVPVPKTIYRGIYKLPPAHTLTYDGGRVRLERYWQPESSTEIRDPDSALEEFESRLAAVVQAHTLSDVPVGVFLSGGLDSTTLVANLERPRTFTLGFDVGSHDESEVAEQTARRFNCEHLRLEASGVDLEEALERVPGMFDEPFGDHGAWPMHMVARLARSRVTVALSGEGGDELFAGYHWYHKWYRQRPKLGDRLLLHLLPPLSNGRRTSERRLATDLDRYALFIGPFARSQKRHLLAPELLDADYDDLWYLRDAWRPELDPIKRLQWADLHTYLVDDMLTKVDRTSMAVSLEARPPLLDHTLVEFALRLHPDLLHDGERGKLLQRRHLAEQAPASVLSRRKTGFTMPVRRWTRRRPELLRGALERLTDAGVTRRLRRHHFSNEQAWCLLVFDRWLTQSGAGL